MGHIDQLINKENPIEKSGWADGRLLFFPLTTAIAFLGPSLIFF